MPYEIWRDAQGEWRWRLKGHNGEIVANGESHPTRAGALRAFHTMAGLAAEAMQDITDEDHEIIVESRQQEADDAEINDELDAQIQEDERIMDPSYPGNRESVVTPEEGDQRYFDDEQDKAGR